MLVRRALLLAALALRAHGFSPDLGRPHRGAPTAGARLARDARALGGAAAAAAAARTSARTSRARGAGRRGRARRGAAVRGAGERGGARGAAARAEAARNAAVRRGAGSVLRAVGRDRRDARAHPGAHRGARHRGRPDGKEITKEYLEKVAQKKEEMDKEKALNVDIFGGKKLFDNYYGNFTSLPEASSTRPRRSTCRRRSTSAATPSSSLSSRSPTIWVLFIDYVGEALDPIFHSTSSANGSRHRPTLSRAATTRPSSTPPRAPPLIPSRWVPRARGRRIRAPVIAAGRRVIPLLILRGLDITQGHRQRMANAPLTAVGTRRRRLCRLATARVPAPRRNVDGRRHNRDRLAVGRSRRRR